MSLAGSEIRRAKLRFGLLTGAVALLVFLVLLLSTLSGALVGALIGALQGLRADGIVYADFARDNIAASRLDIACALREIGHCRHGHFGWKASASLGSEGGPHTHGSRSAPRH